MEKASGGETVDAAALAWVDGRSRNSMPTSTVSSGESGPAQSTGGNRSLPSSSSVDREEGGTVASGWLGLYQPWQP